MTTLRERLKRLLGLTPTIPEQDQQNATDAAQPAPPLALDGPSLAVLMRQIQLTHAGQYTCSETADLLDEYVDLVVSRDDAERLLPLVKGHLDHCVDCTERYEALLRISAAEE